MSPIASKPIDCQPVLPARFWSKVRKTRSCWKWLGAKSDGYGLFWWKGSTIAAHRLAFASMIGPIPADREIDHVCRNRDCVNPIHLRVATHRENVLVGSNFTAKNAAKTCCPKGHPYEIRKRPGGGIQRICRVCANARSSESYHRKKRAERQARWQALWDAIPIEQKTIT